MFTLRNACVAIVNTYMRSEFELVAFQDHVLFCAQLALISFEAFGSLTNLNQTCTFIFFKQVSDFALELTFYYFLLWSTSIFLYQSVFNKNQSLEREF